MPRNNERRMSLNTVGYEPTVFTPIGYRPVEDDLSILERSFAKQEERQKEAQEKVTAVDAALSKIETELHNDPETNAWWNEYKNTIRNQINDSIDVEDWSGAINAAMRAAGRVTSDTSVLGRIKANQEYQAKVDETHKRTIAGKISPDTERWWLDNNEFKYEDVLDKEGNIIGGTSYNTLAVPVDDIDVADFTKKAFDLITPNKTDNKIVNANGTGTHNTRTWVTRQQISDNLNDILDMTPGAREALYQRYQVEKDKLVKLAGDENANSTKVNQQSKLMKKNGSNISFKEFCIRMIEQSAINQNLAYDISSNVTDNQPVKKGSGSGTDVDYDDEQNDQTSHSVTGRKYSNRSNNNTAKSDADAAGADAGNMMEG